MSFLRKLRSLLGKPVVFFTASRYLSYALLFLRGLLVAKFLGPYFFGIWGFITLYQQYLSFTSMGIQYAINTELALLEADDKRRRDALINSSFTLTVFIFVALIVCAVVLQYLNVDIFKNEGSGQFIILTFVIGGLQHFRELFANIFRVFNDYWRIAAGELLIAAVTLLVVFFFKDESLIYYLLIAWAGALTISILFFVIRAPFKIRFHVDRVEAKILFSIGLPLLVYSISYYLMTLSSRTIISIFYDLDIIGYYTFAYTITNATLLGLNAASWVFYPVILARLKEGTEESELRNTISKVTNLYGVAVVMIVYVCIICSPVFYVFLEKYKPAGPALNVLLLSQAVLSLGFIFNTLAIARKKHNQLALFSMASTILSAVLCLLFAILKLDFVWLAIGTLISFVLYTIIICRYGLKLLNIQDLSLSHFFPLSLIFSMLLFLVGTFTPYELVFYFAGLIIFSWANRNNLREILRFVLKPGISK